MRSFLSHLELLGVLLTCVCIGGVVSQVNAELMSAIDSLSAEYQELQARRFGLEERLTALAHRVLRSAPVVSVWAQEQNTKLMMQAKEMEAAVTAAHQAVC